VVVEFEGVTISEASCFCKSHATGSFSALAVSVFDCHDLVGEVAFVHVKVHAVHRNKLDECNVVSLLFLLGDVVSKHKAASLACMCMQIEEHLEAVVLHGLLNNSLPSCPNSGVVALGRSQVHSIEVASHGVKSVVASGDAVWIQNHNYFEYVVLSQSATLFAPQTKQQTKSDFEARILTPPVFRGNRSERDCLEFRLDALVTSGK